MKPVSLTVRVGNLDFVLDPEASAAYVHAKLCAQLERIAERHLARNPSLSANAFYQLVGGRKPDALDAFQGRPTAPGGVRPRDRAGWGWEAEVPAGTGCRGGGRRPRVREFELTATPHVLASVAMSRPDRPRASRAGATLRSPGRGRDRDADLVAAIREFAIEYPALTADLLRRLVREDFATASRLLDVPPNRPRELFE
jgi:hypothetical protein